MATTAGGTAVTETTGKAAVIAIASVTASVRLIVAAIVAVTVAGSVTATPGENATMGVNATMAATATTDVNVMRATTTMAAAIANATQAVTVLGSVTVIRPDMVSAILGGSAASARVAAIVIGSMDVTGVTVVVTAAALGTVTGTAMTLAATAAELEKVTATAESAATGRRALMTMNGEIGAQVPVIATVPVEAGATVTKTATAEMPVAMAGAAGKMMSLTQTVAPQSQLEEVIMQPSSTLIRQRSNLIVTGVPLQVPALPLHQLSRQPLRHVLHRPPGGIFSTLIPAVLRAPRHLRL